MPEGEYTVKVKLSSNSGETIIDYDDWFEKKIFDWMKNPRGVGETVPPLYSPLAVKDNEVSLWGRKYRFGKEGLPESVVSQNKELLSGRGLIEAEIEGKPADIKIETPMAFTSAKPAVVKGKSVLSAGNLKMELNLTMEYDGFMLFQMTYSPVKDKVKINHLRLKLPLQAKYAKFYSAAGDTQGTTVLGNVLPDKQGKVFDSLNNTHSVCCSPSFATLFWVGDYETCFCYASDNDKGWLIRDDAPAVEAYREGDNLVLWLNLVDKEWELTGSRTLEFAFQAGPLKALPEGWRGVQYSGNPDDAPMTILLGSGGTNVLKGGAQIMHPGLTAKDRQKSHDMIERTLSGGKKAVFGYHYWGFVNKGVPETRVFRGEWGIDKETWDSSTSPATKYYWDQRVWGENKDMYVVLEVKPVPSYVDFITYAYDETLKATAMSGFYDDTGYPKEVYDEELGLGFIREDGKQIASSGLWVYRERWKRAAYVNYLNNRPNYLNDSQHVNAHFMPAYGFIGIWAPCEFDYHFPFPGGTMEKYVALNPARQF
ncbi:MAG: DUF6067 family protein, partial [Deltaproteobacteria bacterium]|nr:DUF6067 family protein [Deltaproteobacteria bacterium]